MELSYLQRNQCREQRESQYNTKNTPSEDDPFQRTAPPPPPVHVDGDTERVKSYELEKIVTTRQIARRDIEYLIRWKGFGPEHDFWRNKSEMGNVLKLIRQLLHRLSISLQYLIPLRYLISLLRIAQNAENVFVKLSSIQILFLFLHSLLF